MTRAMLTALVAALCAGALAAAPASAATRECNGLQICVPVAGPWVVVPTTGTTREVVEFLLSCPRGYIVGGLDAEVSTPAVDVTFAGTLGSPVNPGITTSSAAVFSAVYTGPETRTGASMRPHIGCIPASGGGGRVPTSAAAAFPAGHPTVRRARAVSLQPGSTRLSQGCASGERLVSGSHAVGFFTPQPPVPALLAAVQTRRTVTNGHVVVVARANGAVGTVRAVLQVTALCAGGK